MNTCTFVGPATPLSRHYVQEIEAEISQQWNTLACETLRCHIGMPEVHLADAVPGRGILDATLVCACGRPCAVLRRLPNDHERWQCVALPEVIGVPASIVDSAKTR